MPDITDISDEDALVQKIEEVRRDRVAALEAESFTAVQGLHKLEAQLLERLAEVRAEVARSGVPGGSATDEELVEAILEAIPELPDSPFEILADAVAQRRLGRVVEDKDEP